jgi:hypothetical protein
MDNPVTHSTSSIGHRTKTKPKHSTDKNNLDEQYGSHKQKPGVNPDFANDKE